MRTLKPCVFCRFRLLGWYVLFTFPHLSPYNAAVIHSLNCYPRVGSVIDPQHSRAPQYIKQPDRPSNGFVQPQDPDQVPPRAYTGLCGFCGKHHPHSLNMGYIAPTAVDQPTIRAAVSAPPADGGGGWRPVRACRFFLRPCEEPTSPELTSPEPP
jgi:hypothetical protein